jgi:hypothetical protein
MRIHEELALKNSAPFILVQFKAGVDEGLMMETIANIALMTVTNYDIAWLIPRSTSRWFRSDCKSTSTRRKNRDVFTVHFYRCYNTREQIRGNTYLRTGGTT